MPKIRKRPTRSQKEQRKLPKVSRYQAKQAKKEEVQA